MPNEGRIVLVDDDADLSAVISDFLLNKGFAVACYESAVSGWEGLLTNSYDLIILDWDLPDAPGVELCRQYRNAGGIAPVLLMTGRKDIEDKEMGLESGADDYVTKPFSLRELHARIKSLLRRTSTYSPPVTLAHVNECKKGIVVAGKYRMEEAIGRGGMAYVWTATDLQLDRTVVVKLMHQDLADGSETGRRFMHESQTLAKLNHPNIVSVFDSGILNERIPFIVMEYVRGMTLRDWLSEYGPLSPETVIGVMCQLCYGLEEAHNAGIVHRDLKPENILVDEKSHRIDAVKIADFGIAKRLDSKERITREGVVVGTLEYMSPEQLNDSEVDARSDIYALGIMIFELLTNELPFRGSTAEAMVKSHLVGVPILPSAKCTNIEPGSTFDLIVQRCLNKSADFRYQSVAELRADLTLLF